MKQPGATHTDPQAPDCAACIHYYITHDANFPFGCRALNFKSHRKPCLDVLDASGNPCLAFVHRDKNIRT